MSEIEQLRKVAGAATLGTWTLEYEGVDLEERPDEHWPHALHGPQNTYALTESCSESWRQNYGRQVSEIDEMTDADAEHIATFDPPTVLVLLDRLEAAEAKVARVGALADEWRAWDDDDWVAQTTKREGGNTLRAVLNGGTE